jgi:HK97 family phage portal protein
MGILNKLFKPSIEKNYSYQSIFEYVKGDYLYSRKPKQFIGYYLRCSPVFTATKLIKDSAADINPIIFDKKKDQFIYNHSFLELLKRPNPFQNQRQFFAEYFLFYILTGNVYTNIIGDSKPVRLDNYNPQYITIQENSSDGYASSYTYSNSSNSETYKRSDNILKDRKARFLSANGNELIHLKNIDPEGGYNKLYGVSELVGCQIEIDQYLRASEHNNSLLKNGCRPSMLFSIEGELESEQVEEVEESISNKLQGSSNAGRPLVTNSKTTVHQLSQNIKDMDFAGLKKDAMTAIYNCLKIPLAMISQDSSTFNNLESSRYNFYDNTIIPLVQIIYSHLTNNVLKRYPNSENLELAFDPASIESLANRQSQESLQLSQSGVLTVNEIRSKLGYEPILGGDDLYQPMTLAPIGSDQFTDDNRNSPSKSLVDTMTQLKDNQGKPFYNAKEIIKAVKEIENE